MSPQVRRSTAIDSLRHFSAEFTSAPSGWRWELQRAQAHIETHCSSEPKYLYLGWFLNILNNVKNKFCCEDNNDKTAFGIIHIK